MVATRFHEYPVNLCTRLFLKPSCPVFTGCQHSLRKIRHFRPCRTRKKCTQVIATTTDNRKWQCGRQNRKYLYLWNHDLCDRNFKGKPGVFDHAELEETVPGRLRQRTTTGNGSIDVFGANLVIPAVRRYLPFEFRRCLL